MNTLKFSLAILLVNGLCSIHAMEDKKSKKEISSVLQQLQSMSTKKLMSACKGETETVRREYIESLIFRGGARVNFLDDESGRRPLHCAAKNGKLICVQVLLEKKACVNVRDGAGKTPLSYALSQGHDDIARLLKKHR